MDWFLYDRDLRHARVQIKQLHSSSYFNDLYKSTFTPSRLKQLETRTWLYQDYRLETVINMLAK